MKIIFNSGVRSPKSEGGTRNSSFALRPAERGMATFVCVVLMIIMMMLVMAESSALFQLHREMKLLEQKQIQRLEAPPTNSTAATQPGPK